MRNLLNPLWLLIINTLPIGVLFFIAFGEYNIINSLLSEENIYLWKKFTLALSSLAIVNLAYAVLLVVNKRKIPIHYGFAVLLTYIPFLYLFGNNYDDIVPFNIPDWMMSGEMILYVGTFLMPTLAHAILIIVTKLTAENKEYKAWKNFVAAIGVPIVWYLFTQLVIPLAKPFDSDFSIHAIIVFFIIGTIIFLFFLVRAIYILVLKKGEAFGKYHLAWKIPITLVFPLIGLAVNQGHVPWEIHSIQDGMLGDFGNFWFYVLAVLNGVIICLPNTKHKVYRLFLFLGRSITFAYTFYFFLVFLPYLPLSIPAIVAFGAGFLMLTPLILFVIHVHQLSLDFRFLQTYFSKSRIALFSAMGILSLPLLITATYIQDRSVMMEALDYIYTPDYSRSYSIDENSLSSTLEIVKKHKARGRDFGFGNHTPYLSGLFNWLVLDNMTLSDGKIEVLEKVFFDKGSVEASNWRFRRASPDVKLTSISSESNYDKEQNAWTSWVNMEITNGSENSWNQEYVTEFELPEGCWISDYYLYIGDRKEMGILAEKKAAMWVYNQITNTNRDPGLLHYLTGNKVAFRVFPFRNSETRKTGFQLVHKEPLVIDIDGHKAILGNKEEQSESNSTSCESNGVIYVSRDEKKKLKAIQRSPYYHFIVDASEGNEEFRNVFIDRIETLINQKHIKGSNFKISISNSITETENIESDWKDKISNSTCRGGFYLERAIVKVLFEAHQQISDRYPVIDAALDIH